MSELIDRQAAIAYAISGMTREIDGDKWIRVSEVRESIKTMPSAQPEPSQVARDICTILENELDMRVILKNAQPERKKGKWIDDGFYADYHGEHVYRCSECGQCYIANGMEWDFCPYCGSDNREVKE